MPSGKFELKVTPSGEVAYLYLPDHPGRDAKGVAVKQVSLKELLPSYDGATLYFDFDQDGRLIGVEVLA
ncbi:hypothetical protein CfE428DRAFT_5520 [Chthoniobacter flavus Ellin428]|uniref:DUF2283 domain-containing protein n=1 Tax=Chthoniobacter flavus Ellin428 TaxID=497964 RepID=B4D9D0_9BACT|nr:hypothetical protein CfE428DRAFT_5520 [Chthoniobacter flavus Ellin428]TCO87774.1 uncharacterized protein DUF2283 [Chthoniobacter flavus]